MSRGYRDNFFPIRAEYFSIG